MEELKRKLEAVVSTLNKEELDKLFPEMAEFIMKNYGIEAHGKVYFMNEIEFYYYDPLYDDIRIGSKTSHITFERTAAAGCWFIHNYGFDLTFKSDMKQGYGGGILIRSIEDSMTTDTITGPVNCLNELWEETVDAFSATAPNPKIVRIKERIIQFNDPDTRVKVGKVDSWHSLWRFSVKGEKISTKE